MFSVQTFWQAARYQLPSSESGCALWGLTALGILAISSFLGVLSGVRTSRQLKNISNDNYTEQKNHSQSMLLKSSYFLGSGVETAASLALLYFLFDAILICFRFVIPQLLLLTKCLSLFIPFAIGAAIQAYKNLHKEDKQLTPALKWFNTGMQTSGLNICNMGSYASILYIAYFFMSGGTGAGLSAKGFTIAAFIAAVLSLPLTILHLLEDKQHLPTMDVPASDETGNLDQELENEGYEELPDGVERPVTDNWATTFPVPIPAGSGGDGQVDVEDDAWRLGSVG